MPKARSPSSPRARRATVRRQAIDVLLDQRLFVFDPERHDAFMCALENSPAPGPKLRSLLRRVPAWKR